MNKRSLRLLLVFGSLLVLRALGAGAPGEASPPPNATAGKNASSTHLVKGMSAAQVITLLGKPAAIEVIENPDVKAESWTYRRLLDQHTDQDAATTGSVPMFIGAGIGDGRTVGDRPVAKYVTRRTSNYQVTVLLMVNDQFVIAKQREDAVVSYGY